VTRNFHRHGERDALPGSRLRSKRAWIGRRPVRLGPSSTTRDDGPCSSDLVLREELRRRSGWRERWALRWRERGDTCMTAEEAPAPRRRASCTTFTIATYTGEGASTPFGFGGRSPARLLGGSAGGSAGSRRGRVPSLPIRLRLPCAVASSSGRARSALVVWQTDRGF